jgi:hypothetical protein
VDVVGRTRNLPVQAYWVPCSLMSVRRECRRLNFEVFTNTNYSLFQLYQEHYGGIYKVARRVEAEEKSIAPSSTASSKNKH